MATNLANCTQYQTKKLNPKTAAHENCKYGLSSKSSHWFWNRKKRLLTVNKFDWLIEWLNTVILNHFFSVNFGLKAYFSLVSGAGVIFYSFFVCSFLICKLLFVKTQGEWKRKQKGEGDVNEEILENRQRQTERKSER